MYFDLKSAGDLRKIFSSSHFLNQQSKIWQIALCLWITISKMSLILDFKPFRGKRLEFY